MKISEIEFEDLYLGVGFADVKGRRGFGDARTPAPPEWADAVEEIRRECAWRYQKNEVEEFTLVVDGVLLRVTVFSDVHDEPVFVLRRSLPRIFPLSDLGLPGDVMDFLMSPRLRGLVLFGGRMKMGKTSSAASLIKARGEVFPDVVFAFEEPVETLLNGELGKGRVITIPVSPSTGGYPKAMDKAVRSGANAMFIGEIRNPETAEAVLLASMTGLVFSTTHGDSLENMLERFHSFVKTRFSNAADMMANVLSSCNRLMKLRKYRLV